MFEHIDRIEKRLNKLEKQIKDLSNEYKKILQINQQLKSALNTSYKMTYDEITKRHHRHKTGGDGK